MKYIFILGALALVLLFTGSKPVGNPFLTEWDTPFGVPPFDVIKIEHYKPAFEQAMEKHNKEINDIATQKADPTLANTIVAMDQSGELLDRVASVFFSMNSCLTNVHSFNSLSQLPWAPFAMIPDSLNECSAF